MKQYYRLILTSAVIAVVALAHVVATFKLGYERIAPLYSSSDDDLQVATASSADSLSVSSLDAVQLEVGTSSEEDFGAERTASSQSLQTPAVTNPVAPKALAPTASVGGTPVINGQNGIPTAKNKHHEITLTNFDLGAPSSTMNMQEKIRQLLR